MVRKSRLVWLAVLLFLSVTGAATAGTCLGLEGSPGDVDGDGFQGAVDCNDADPALWSTPGETENLLASKIGSDISLTWDPPADSGSASSSQSYDLYRTIDPAGGTWDCVATALDVPSSSDRDLPLPNQVFYYVTQSSNECGGGNPGSDSSGQPRGPLVCDCAALCDDGDACTEDLCQSGACSNPLIRPSIRLVENGLTACAGGIAKFYGNGARVTGVVSYQWLLNGLPVGIDSPELELSSLSPGDDGAIIELQLTDGCTTATSDPIVLNVFADPASCAGGLDGFGAPNGASHPMALLAGGGGGGGGAIYLHSGEYFRQEIDLTIPGRGFDFSWTRTYRSREPIGSGHGSQWTHSYERRVEQGPTGELLLHDGAQGRVDLYFPSPIQPGCFESPGFFRNLCIQPDGRYVLTFADKSEWIFRPIDPADGPEGDGFIEASVDRNGNNMFFNYDPFGRLELIVDTLSRPIQVTYDLNGQIDSLIDFTGRAVTYDYYEANDEGGSAGDLKSVSTPVVTGTPHGNDFPQGKTRIYTYTTGFGDDRLNHNLLTITAPNELTYLQNAYTATDIQTDLRFDRLDHTDLDGGRLSYTYVQVPPDPVFPQIVSGTYVNDRAGNVSLWEFDGESRLVRETQFTGRTPDASRPTNGVQNAPVNPLRVDDPPSFETVVLHNNHSLPEFIQFPRGNQLHLQYDSQNQDPRLRGNLLQRVRMPGPLGGSQQTILESWTYATDYGTTWPVFFAGEKRRTSGGGSHGGRGGHAGRASFDDDSMSSDSMSMYGAASDHNSEESMSSDWMFIGDDDSSSMDSISAMITRTADHDSMSSADMDSMFSMDARRGDDGSSDDDSSDDRARGSNDHSSMVDRRGSRRRTYRGGGSGGAIYIGAASKAASPGEIERDGDRVPIYAFPSTYTDGSGQTYVYIHDPANGNLDQLETPQVVTGTLGGSPQTVRESWIYNSFGQVTLYVNPSGRVDSFTYHTVAPQLGYLQSVVIDQPGQALTTSYEYDPVGNVQLVTDPRGSSTQSVYNQLNQRVRLISSAPFLYERDFYYDSNDNLVRIDVEDVDEDGLLSLNPYLSTTYVYDILDRRVRVQVETGAGGSCVAEEYEYDANSNPTLRLRGEATNGNDPDNVTRYLFDERDLLFRATHGEGSGDASTTQYDYDPNGNKRAVREGLEDPTAPNVTLPAYDGYDRLVAVEDPEGNLATFDYDANDNLVERRVDGESPQGSGTSLRLYEEQFFYDEIDRVFRSEAHHFDTPTGNPTGDGISTLEWFYDPDSRLVRVEDDNGNADSASYDTARRLLTATDSRNNTRTYDYDANSNVTTITEVERSDLGLGDETFVTTYAYDSLDRRVLVTDNAGFEQEYAHDSRSQLKTYFETGDNVTRYAYDGMSTLR